MAVYDDIVNLALRRGIFFPSSEIYANAPAGFYDYGPYGAAIRRKIVDLWRKHLVQKNEMLEIEGSVIMSSDVFKSSGHLTSFADPVTKCTKCNAVYRADKLLEDATGVEFKEAMKEEELTAALKSHKVKCLKCRSELSAVFKSSLMVKAELGIAGQQGAYLRPETCQSIFCDFSRMLRTMRVKLPKGMAQVGKSFRNEISPRQTILRQVEFAQMEIEVFFDPESKELPAYWQEVKDVKLPLQLAKSKKIEKIAVAEAVKKKIISSPLFAYYLAQVQLLYEHYGIPAAKMRFRQLDDEERAFYAKEGWDFEVETSLGWLELIANNYRTDYDLKGHMQGSKTNLEFTDDSGRKFIPHVWEISAGLDRTFYAILEFAYRKEGERILLSLKPEVAPLHAAVFPLLSNRPELVKKAREVAAKISSFEVFYDESGTVGKRYARMDEIGCPFCVTVDFDSLENDDVTIRERDTTKQKRVKITELPEALYMLVIGRKNFEKL